MVRLYPRIFDRCPGESFCWRLQIPRALDRHLHMFKISLASCDGAWVSRYLVGETCMPTSHLQLPLLRVRAPPAFARSPPTRDALYIQRRLENVYCRSKLLASSTRKENRRPYVLVLSPKQPGIKHSSPCYAVSSTPRNIKTLMDCFCERYTLLSPPPSLQMCVSPRLNELDVLPLLPAFAWPCPASGFCSPFPPSSSS